MRRWIVRAAFVTAALACALPACSSANDARAVSEDGGDSDGAADASLDGSDAQPDARWDATSDGSTESGSGGGSVGALCASSLPCDDGMVACGACVSKTDPAHGCGSPTCQACNLPHAVATCGAQGCAIASCQPGWKDCNGNASDGCEADLSSPATCGSCNVACTAPNNLCTASGCAGSCVPPLTLCTDRCVDLSKDPAHCGGCTTACAWQNGTPTCAGGSCGLTCSAGLTACSQAGTEACVDTTSDPNHCGSCSTACPSTTGGTATCSNGKCGMVCPRAWTFCNGACVTTQTDPSNCGACGNTCAASSVCVAGVCKPQSSLWLATGITAKGLALDNARVYWVDGTSAVLSVPIGGGTVSTLAQAQQKPLGIAADGTFVYWSNNLGGAIMRAPGDGSGTPQIVATATQPTYVAVDASYVYWMDSVDTTVWKAPKNGGSAGAAFTKSGDIYLISSPFGPLVLNSGGTGLNGIYNVNTGAKFGFYAPNNFAIAQDGQYVWGSLGGTYHPCQVSWYDMSGTTQGGAVEIGSQYDCGLPPMPLAGNACGMFVGNTRLTHGSSTIAVKLQKRGFIPAAVAYIGQWDYAVADASYVYFVTGQSLGKLPLP